MRRIHRAQLLRNVAVALGNVGGPDEVAPLARAFAEPSPLVRAHVAWALGRIGARHPSAAGAARAALGARRAAEADPEVREELDHALASIAPR
jgi:epoxyqueuosine reductase